MLTVISILTTALSFQAVSSQTISASFSPNFLEYNESVTLTFTLGVPCAAGRFSLITYTMDSSGVSTPTHWDGTNYLFHDPDNLGTAVISYANFSNSADYYALCNNEVKSTTTYSPSPLSVNIPVAPKILEVTVEDDRRLSTLQEYQNDEETRTSTWKYTVYFDLDNDQYALLAIKIGNGYYVDSVGDTYTGTYITTDEEFNLMVNLEDTPIHTVIDMSPDFPDGTSHLYRLDANQWAQSSEQCTATLNILSVISQATAVGLTLRHEGIIELDFNFKPKLLVASATGTASSCTLTCTVTASCPSLQDGISMEIEITDADGNLLGSQTGTNLMYHSLSYTGSKSMCETIISLAGAEEGTFKCVATNSIGTETVTWQLKDVANLSGLSLQDTSSLEWWQYLLIVIGCVVFLLIVAVLVAVSIRRAKSDDNGKNDNYATPPRSNASTMSDGQAKFEPSINPVIRQDQFTGNMVSLEPMYLQQRAPSQVGSSFQNGGHDSRFVEAPYTRSNQVYDDFYHNAAPTVAVNNTPGSRRPISYNETSMTFDNNAYIRTPNLPTTRAEALV